MYSLANSFIRDGGYPIDADSVKSSTSELYNFLSSDACYPGMIVSIAGSDEASNGTYEIYWDSIHNTKAYRKIATTADISTAMNNIHTALAGTTGVDVSMSWVDVELNTTNNESYGGFRIPCATTTGAGVMSSADKIKLDNILVVDGTDQGGGTISINATWTQLTSYTGIQVIRCNNYCYYLSGRIPTGSSTFNLQYTRMYADAGAIRVEVITVQNTSGGPIGSLTTYNT